MFEKLPTRRGWSFPKSVEIQVPWDPEGVAVLSLTVLTGLFFLMYAGFDRECVWGAWLVGLLFGTQSLQRANAKGLAIEAPGDADISPKQSGGSTFEAAQCKGAESVLPMKKPLHLPHVFSLPWT